jgi:hypothetical protein
VRSTLELADIFRRHGTAYAKAHAQIHGGHLGLVERRVMSAIELWRTAALGGHVERCDDCAHSRIAYNSCRNRHCPKCQGAARDQWLADREADLLPVPYCHAVFTVPGEVAAMAYQKKRLLYGILFEAVAATLKTIAADPRHRLGGDLGFIGILHTWGQTLTHHPHIHCLVPGGVLAADGSRCISCKPGFFLPVHVLSKLFRRLFIDRLHAAYAAGQLQFFADLAPLHDDGRFAEAIRALRKKRWITCAKPPFGSPAHVLAHLGRYTHRVAIFNGRLVRADDAGVTFRWKVYRQGNASRDMTLQPHEFIRRFLLHCLPGGFHRIRHYGVLANGIRLARLAQIRHLIAEAPGGPTAPARSRLQRITFDPSICPCFGGTVRITATLARGRRWPDTS